MRTAGAELRNNGNSDRPVWYDIYFLAMVENDRDLALARIERAQNAINERLAELHEIPPADTREMRDLTSALIYLGILLKQIGCESERLLWD